MDREQHTLEELARIDEVPTNFLQNFTGGNNGRRSSDNILLYQMVKYDMQLEKGLLWPFWTIHIARYLRHTEPVSQDDGITLCMCVENLADSEPVLRALRDSVDEAVVVYTGTPVPDFVTDFTERHDIKAIFHSHDKDSSYAKNTCLRYSTQSYVLFLEEDEELDPEDIDMLREAAQEFPYVSGFNLNQKDAIGDLIALDPEESGPDKIRRHDGLVQYPNVKFFKNLPQYFFVYPMHESVVPSINHDGGMIRNFPVDVIKSGFDYEDRLSASDQETLVNHLEIVVAHLENHPYYSKLIEEYALICYHMSLLTEDQELKIYYSSESTRLMRVLNNFNYSWDAFQKVISVEDWAGM